MVLQEQYGEFALWQISEVTALYSFFLLLYILCLLQLPLYPTLKPGCGVRIPEDRLDSFEIGRSFSPGCS